MTTIATVYVKPGNRQLEEEMDELKLEHIAHLNPQASYLADVFKHLFVAYFATNVQLIRCTSE